MAERSYNIFKRDPFELEINPDNVRGEITQADIDEKMYSLAEHGQLEPITVFQLTKGKAGGFRVLEGNTRTLAARQGIERKLLADDFKLDCKTADEDHTSPDGQIIYQLTNDKSRNKYSPMALAKSYMKLKREHGYTDASLAKALHVSSVHIKETLSLLSLPMELKDAITSKRISATAVKQARKTKSDSEILDVVKQSEKRKVTKRELDGTPLVDKVMELRAKKAESMDEMEQRVYVERGINPNVPDVIMVAPAPPTIDEVMEYAKKKYPTNFVERNAFVAGAKWFGGL